MTTTAPTIIILQIDRFHNCEGCIRKLKLALGKLGGVRLLAIDPEIGKITISTVDLHPGVIRVALEHKFFRKVVILSPQINPLHNSIIHQNPSSAVTSLLGGTHVNVDIAKALSTMYQAQELESVEFTQSNTFRLNFINRENQPAANSGSLHNRWGSNDVHFEDDDGGFRPSPSAPLIPTAQAQVYGYPTHEIYGLPRTWSDDDFPKDCCNIL